MTDVYVLGSYSTSFGRYLDRSFRELTQEAVLGAIQDAGLSSGLDIGSAWFGNVLMHRWGTHSTRGQNCLLPLKQIGMLSDRLPVTNVEGGCATGSLAVQGALKDILAGVSGMTLAVGVEKVNRQTTEATIAMYEANDDLLVVEAIEEYRKLAELTGKPFDVGSGRTIFMDTYAQLATYHMKRFGLTQRQIAMVSAKSHCNGALNPKAQYRFGMSVDDVLGDREVSFPLTRAMCAPTGDGAAAAILCSGDVLRTMPISVRERAVRVAASTLTSGKMRLPDEPGLSREAARRAYAQAGIEASAINVAEVHDATSFGEIYESEMLGFCAAGEGGAFVEAGETAISGSKPINTSGGLVSKGHPVGATGLSMLYELVTQLRGEAGPRQVTLPRYALLENGGGLTGLENAACVVMILDAGSRSAPVVEERAA